MPCSNDAIQKTLRLHLEGYPGDGERCRPLFELLKQERCLSARSTFPAHVTASGMVLHSRNGEWEALLIHHNSLQLWLCPGGHIENDDDDLFAACLREIEEEAGIPSRKLRPLSFPPIPIDIDDHVIPANPSKGEGEHTHWDFRFLVIASNRDVTAQLCEVAECQWKPLQAIEQLASGAPDRRMLRCLERARRLLVQEAA
jgi:8-oxo-dGTP pyrophosphatase MutT (NUDIX family)